MEPGRRDTARSRAIRALAWLSLALVSCLDASFLSAPSAVGPQGGAFTFAGGAVVLQVPPGAVAQPVGLSVEPARAFTPSELVVPGSVFELHPVGLRLAVPVSLSLRYRTSALPAIVDESELRVFRATRWRDRDGSNRPIERVRRARRFGGDRQRHSGYRRCRFRRGGAVESNRP